MSDLGLGAVGLIDALGFKDIKKRHAVTDILATLREAKATAVKMTEVLGGGGGHYAFEACGCSPAISAIAFSDTIAFTASAPSTTGRAGCLAVTASIVAAGLTYIIRHTAKTEVPLVYRGVITTGELLVDQQSQLFLGDAVDEAADLMDTADGAFVWLSPDTSALSFGSWQFPAWKHLLTDYDVPLKGGRTIKTKVVNPFCQISHTHEDFDRIRQGYLTAMASNKIDVVVKRQNTEALLHHFEKESRRQIELLDLERKAREE